MLFLFHSKRDARAYKPEKAKSDLASHQPVRGVLPCNPDVTSFVILR